ncbi:hypothetical protein HPP92_013169 [Vanilla planifolia]|uniref:GTP cyclohydrolase 1 n=1 Tax=Vanilla planifolia TaxID=51239 RepID=A0A835UZR5_VANPL|nr:hypothetical protein HPP92_013169 [Vanilla planifolia]
MGALDDGQFDANVGETAIVRGGGGSGAMEIEDAVRILLIGLGENLEREGLRKTPLRVAKAFREGTRGYGQKVKDILQGALFPEAGFDHVTGQAGGTGGLVVVRDINLFSYCESCLLPFSIRCHIGYVTSGKRVVGLSKLSRVADIFAKRLQEPQRLADELSHALQNSFTPAGVSVILYCWHIQFPEVVKCDQIPWYPSESGIQGWLQTSVCSRTGVFKDKNSSFWEEFKLLLKFRGASFTLGDLRGTLAHAWCPSRSLDLPGGNGRISSLLVGAQSEMLAAVTSIIWSLGEDPFRKELVGTPARYVHWLMKFKKSILEMKHNGFLLHKTDPHESSNGHVHIADEMSTELNLPFCAQCEHHLLPFHGVVHVGYFSDGEKKAIDRPALQSMVQFFGCKLQVQERLTKQIAQEVDSVTGKGVMVVVEANHICMISRGIEKTGSSTATIAVTGKFSSDASAKALFLETISRNAASGG